VTNNDVLRRLRYALDLSDAVVLDLFALAEAPIAAEELGWYLRKEEEEGYAECPDEVLGKFLDGLVASRRGKREEGAAKAPVRRKLDNNGILRSLRIALELKDEDIIAIMRAANVDVSKSEVSALFRKADHPNYRPCGDQFLRYFFNGLTARFRSRSGPASRA
jgi:uncharacterized protein YehS (DUF1456 family)